MAKLLSYDPRFLPDFVALNRQWIEQHFRLEPMDLKQLEDPRALILDPGGEILFLREENRTVGTVALIPHGPGCFELAKMAVDVTARGLGYGDALMEGAIARARARGARKLTLLSNTILAPAIRLYEKHGFRTVHLGPHADYDRANIEMELDL